MSKRQDFRSPSAHLAGTWYYFSSFTGRYVY